MHKFATVYKAAMNKRAELIPPQPGDPTHLYWLQKTKGYERHIKKAPNYGPGFLSLATIKQLPGAVLDFVKNPAEASRAAAATGHARQQYLAQTNAAIDQRNLQKWQDTQAMRQEQAAANAQIAKRWANRQTPPPTDPSQPISKPQVANAGGLKNTLAVK